MDNPFSSSPTKSDEGDKPKVENVEEVVEEIESQHSKQMKVVAEATAKLEAALDGRLEMEVGLEEDYWKLRDGLHKAHRRLEDLR